jgi:hypothetical protein
MYSSININIFQFFEIMIYTNSKSNESKNNNPLEEAIIKTINLIISLTIYVHLFLFNYIFTFT